MSRWVAIAMCSTIALAACADRPEVTSEAPTPNVATIVCDETGTTVETPSVRPQLDGLHVVIDNRTEVDPGFSVAFDHGGLGDNAPQGTSKHVLDVPPGIVRIGCYTGARGSGERDLQALEVVDADGVYRSTELTCESGSSTGVSDYVPGAKGETSDPVDLARATFESAIGGLEPDDVAERAGYPEWDEPIVRLVRAGEVVATIRYREADDGGWLQDTMSMCEGLTAG
jgi:hypothetical protein